MKINSAAFRDGHQIPDKFTRFGENAVPPLQWDDVPEGTQSFALQVEDPDASKSPFVHCVIYNIPADRLAIDEPALSSSKGVVFATNDFGNRGYDGPEPPKEHGPHRYVFRLAALDVPELDVRDWTKASDVWRQACIHSLAISELTGRYEKT
ncbi:YbhB/YbcL family Raf kinase inhibitor-like protein [Rhizobium sp. L1K21]|uniref:YbhB/YbcL family Raf kinase inhibitor-like protein n=1 Tax=Rhizobium sp. L1K21 TaxID=2954933 RepID=UPI002093420A|nr:YbhB/YbcL family Raf kinase inhibitor-like protein [Rhizobium sp. L1K21]MCO6187828.1 YbhB/YbcL family Raf kinase inhibitor-like protein [Rhizobium sp. L1K21]